MGFEKYRLKPVGDNTNRGGAFARCMGN